MTTKKTDFAPRKTVSRIICPKCGELMLKVYPWSSYTPPEAQPIVPCRKCLGREAMKIISNQKETKKRRIAR